MSIRPWCIPLVNTVQDVDQTMVHSTSQHGARCPVKSLCIPLVKSVWDVGDIILHSTSEGVGHTVQDVNQINEQFTSQLGARCKSDHRAFYQSTRCKMSSDHRAFHWSTRCKMTIRPMSMLLANTVPDVSHSIVHATSQHSARGKS